MSFRRDGPGALTEMPAQPGTAFANPSARSFAATFPITRTETSPTRKMFRVRKLVHVESDLGDDAPGTHAINAGNRAQPPHGIFKRAEPFLDRRFQPDHFRLDEFQVVQ